MNYLHQDFDAGPKDVIEVTLDGQANVMLMDSPNYAAYKRGQNFKYYGGLATVSPFRLEPPHQAHWNLVIDLGGYAGHVKAGVRILQHA